MSTPMYPADLSELKHEAPYVNCQKFTEWLEQRFTVDRIFERMNSVDKNDRWARRYYHWKHESLTNRVQVGKIDEFLVEVFGIEVMVEDLPEWLFCFTSGNPGNSPATTEMRRNAVARIRAGESPSTVAQDLGRSVSTVAKWSAKARRDDLAAAA